MLPLTISPDLSPLEPAGLDNVPQLAHAERLKETWAEKRRRTSERSLNKVEQTRQMVLAPTTVFKLRGEAERVAVNRLTHGVVLLSFRRQPSATISTKHKPTYCRRSLVISLLKLT